MGNGGDNPPLVCALITSAVVLSRNAGPDGNPDFDGKRPRKTMMRKTVDYNSSFLNMLQNRVWQRDHRDRSGNSVGVRYSSTCYRTGSGSGTIGTGLATV